jgi:predicted transcriptional regulator
MNIYVIAPHSNDVMMSHASSSGEGPHSAELAGRMLSRSHLEEEMMILSAVRGGANSMDLLQTKTNLPWSILRDTAGSLLKAGLLTVDDDNQIPRLSLRTKGLELIERYRGVLERIATARAVIQVGSN